MSSMNVRTIEQKKETLGTVAYKQRTHTRKLPNLYESGDETDCKANM